MTCHFKSDIEKYVKWGYIEHMVEKSHVLAITEYEVSSDDLNRFNASSSRNQWFDVYCHQIITEL